MRVYDGGEGNGDDANESAQERGGDYKGVGWQLLIWVSVYNNKRTLIESIHYAQATPRQEWRSGQISPP